MENISVCVAPPIVDSLSFSVITSAALVDSINPCAITVLLILLASLLTTTKKRRVFLSGLLFIFGLFVAYFLAGIGLFKALNLVGLAEWLHLLVGILAVVLGLLNIKDYFWYGGGGFVTEIPRSWRPHLKKFLNGISSPLFAFLGGLIVIIFELPCTGGPYLFTLGYLATLPKVSLVPILLYYNFVFVLPLIVVLVLVSFGFSDIDKASKWKDRNLKLLHLLSGIMMLALGIWVIFK